MPKWNPPPPYEKDNLGCKIFCHLMVKVFNNAGYNKDGSFLPYHVQIKNDWDDEIKKNSHGCKSSLTNIK